MHKQSLFTAAIVSMSATAYAQTVYSGYDTEFSYSGFGDVNLAENQDRITDMVWLTRNTTRGIFNIAQEPAFNGMGDSSPSPIGTLWALGTTAEYDTLSYGTWAACTAAAPRRSSVKMWSCICKTTTSTSICDSPVGAGQATGAPSAMCDQPCRPPRLWVCC